MKLTGNCLTTAMGVLPHDNLEDALRLAFSLDIPFWPQLPKFSFYEDMYVQACENFPGIKVDEEKFRVSLDTYSFYKDLPDYAIRCGNEETFKLSAKYSLALNRFLREDFKNYRYIRGQNIGPISFGLKICDENLKPIIYNDDIREFLYDFIAQKVNVQYKQLKQVHENPFVWLDEPGLEMIFSSFTGYPSSRAKEDFEKFLSTIQGPRGVHLCGNPDWSFLLSGLDLDILSIDVFGNGEIFIRYSDEINKFLGQGGIISWGIVPTLTEEVNTEEVITLADKLVKLWTYLDKRGIKLDLIVSQAWLAPARCCLINANGVQTIERSFALLNDLAAIIKERFGLL
jgi:hypothetical protein